MSIKLILLRKFYKWQGVTMRQAQELLGVLEPRPVMATVHGALPLQISLEGFGFLEAIKSLGEGRANRGCLRYLFWMSAFRIKMVES